MCGREFSSPNLALEQISEQKEFWREVGLPKNVKISSERHFQTVFVCSTLVMN